MALASGYYMGTTASAVNWYSYSTGHIVSTSNDWLPPPPRLKLATARPRDWLRQEMKPWLRKKTEMFRPDLHTELRRGLEDWLKPVLQ